MNANPTPPAVAIQLYTLRDFLKTPGQIAQTLRRVKQIGYNAVELAGLANIDAAQLATMLQNEGLTCCSIHVPMEKLQTDPQRVMADLRLWNCSLLAVPGCWGKTFADFEKFTADLSTLAEQFAAAGMRLGYHNHSHEFVRHHGRAPLHLMLDKLSPHTWFEIDTYWIVHGGGDPIQWIGQVAGRIPCVHLKDMAIDSDGKQFMAEVGEGNLNWPGILTACRAAGTRWLIVEQDTCRRDPFESVAISLRNLREMGLA